MATSQEKLDEIRTVNREIPAGSVHASGSGEKDANRDAITGAPGSHPVGTGIGAAAAGAAGAAIGSVVPGIGTAIGGAVGAVVGAVAGGYAGKAVAESINPTDEHAYWEASHKSRDYYDSSLDYDRDYRGAYNTGIEVYNENPGRAYAESESDLRSRWNQRRGESKLDWDKASRAMRDVFERDRTSGSGVSGSNVTAINDRPNRDDNDADDRPGTSPTAGNNNPVRNI
ncbi:MAG TPA: hypothetical protein VF624_15345 [Tepidisphaeraceae bacterium]|jgi:hypothetical protein